MYYSSILAKFPIKSIFGCNLLYKRVMFWKYGNMFCFLCLLGKAKAHLLHIMFGNLYFVQTHLFE